MFTARDNGSGFGQIEGDSSVHLSRVLTQVLEGDSAAAQLLYHRYAQQLVRLANRRISQVFNAKIDGEDIVQSVFRTFFVRHRSGRIEFVDWNQLWAFLVRVTIHKCNEKVKWMLREKRNVNRDRIERDHENGYRVAHDVVSPEPTPQQVLIFEETLSELVRPLNATQREIVALRLQGFSNEQIAKKLGRTERTVYRSLGQLRQRMKAIEAAHK